MNKRIKIGDVIEITTAKGLAYAQFYHSHPRYGSLLRILPGCFQIRPIDIAALVQEREMFVTFIPLQASLNRGIFEVVTNCSVPVFAESFPLFRTGIPDPLSKKVTVWWLWDGEREWKVGALKPEHMALPVRGIWNDTLLIERIQSGWTPNDDSE